MINPSGKYKTERALVVVAKAPLAGLAKTRLSPPLTHFQAALLYECLLADIVDKMERYTGSDLWLACAPEGKEYFKENFTGRRLLVQRGKDLGERLHNILVDLFQMDYREMVIADSDSPSVPLSWIDQAYQSLHRADCDVVLGPSCDGGYYLVGLKRPQAEIFNGIPWSTAKVLKKTLSKVQALRLKATLLPLAYDIDVAEDLKRLWRDFHESSSLRALAPRTFTGLACLFDETSPCSSKPEPSAGDDQP